MGVFSAQLNLDRVYVEPSRNTDGMVGNHKQLHDNEHNSSYGASLALGRPTHLTDLDSESPSLHLSSTSLSNGTQPALDYAGQIFEIQNVAQQYEPINVSQHLPTRVSFLKLFPYSRRAYDTNYNLIPMDVCGYPILEGAPTDREHHSYTSGVPVRLSENNPLHRLKPTTESCEKHTILLEGLDETLKPGEVCDLEVKEGGSHSDPASSQEVQPQSRPLTASYR